MRKNIKNIDKTTNKLLEEAKAAISKVEPEAELYLFGSRARGDYNDDSDWDFLVLLPGKIDYERKNKIYDTLYDIELKFFEVFNVLIYMKNFWNQDKVFQSTPFNKNVTKEKIRI